MERKVTKDRTKFHLKINFIPEIKNDVLYIDEDSDTN